MRYSLLFLPLVLLLAMACGSDKSRQAAAEKKTALSDTAKFYPLAGYFKDQIQYVDLRNFPIYRIQTIDGKRDSVSISKDAFARLASLFLQRSLSEPGLKIRYRESVFEDLSTGSITLSYSPLNDTETVKEIDVLLDNQSQIVKRIFIRSAYQKGDTLINEQCNWKSNKSFQINRSISYGKGIRKNEMNFVNWNDRP
ncbi:MAG: hypothetical protein KGO92_00185 [Bacteroidota bacterium]|nr:hypothetical protein [Bacteroidota bacterium]